MTQVHCIAMLFIASYVDGVGIMVQQTECHYMARAGVEIEPVSIGFIHVPLLGLCQMVIHSHECEGFVK